MRTNIKYSREDVAQACEYLAYLARLPFTDERQIIKNLRKICRKLAVQAAGRWPA